MIYVLAVCVVSLIALVGYLEQLHYRERKDLIERIQSNSYNNYLQGQTYKKVVDKHFTGNGEDISEIVRDDNLGDIS